MLSPLFKFSCSVFTFYEIFTNLQSVEKMKNALKLKDVKHFASFLKIS